MVNDRDIVPKDSLTECYSTIKYLQIPCNTKEYHPQGVSGRVHKPSNTIKYLQLPSNTFKYLQTPSNTIKKHKIPSNTFKYHQISWNILPKDCCSLVPTFCPTSRNYKNRYTKIQICKYANIQRYKYMNI